MGPRVAGKRDKESVLGGGGFAWLLGVIFIILKFNIAIFFAHCNLHKMRWVYCLLRMDMSMKTFNLRTSQPRIKKQPHVVQGGHPGAPLFAPQYGMSWGTRPFYEY